MAPRKKKNTPKQDQWRNRIVGQGKADPKRLKQNTGNWRMHPQLQKDALREVLDQVGWVQQIIVNKKTGNMVDGHLRVELAIQRKEKLVPVLYVDLSRTEENKILATLDPIAALADADNDKLTALLKRVSVSDGALQDVIEQMKSECIEIPETEIPDPIADESGAKEKGTFLAGFKYFPIIVRKEDADLVADWFENVVGATGDGVERAEKLVAWIKGQK